MSEENKLMVPEENRLGPLKLKRRYEADDSYWVVRFARPKFVRAGQVARWRGFPKDYEWAFAMRMYELERQGIMFSEVLRETLPKSMGNVSAEVLRRWVGKESRQSPIRFVKTVNKMFGASAKPLLTSIQASAGGHDSVEDNHESVLAYLAKQVEEWGEPQKSAKPVRGSGSHA